MAPLSWRSPSSGYRFFFQAEDGIRGWSVTGVQTCALPISRVAVSDQYSSRTRDTVVVRRHPERVRARSEERRVGKECKYGRPANQEKKVKLPDGDCIDLLRKVRRHHSEELGRAS